MAKPIPALVPWPRELELGEGAVELEAPIRLVADDGARPQARALADALAASGLDARVGDRGAGADGIELRLEPAAGIEHDHEILVDDRVRLRGRGPASLARAAAALLQLAEPEGPRLRVPRLRIRDAPDAPFRAVLIDVARQPIGVDVLRRIVEMCRWYRIGLLQLHLTDDQGWTLPSRAFPALGSANERGIGVYDRGELRALVDFAEARGVTLVPEVDLPGHAGAMLRACGEIFDPIGAGQVNVATAPVWEALDAILDEVVELFAPSPYVHVGGDEAGDLRAIFEHYAQDPWVRERRLSSPAELFTRFLSEITARVEARGKRALVWEGHRPVAALSPRPILVPWDNAAYPLPDMLADGYEVVNAPFCPLYLLEGGTDVTPRFLYERWDRSTFGRYLDEPRSIERSELDRVDPTPRILGAMLCSWENRAEFQMEGLRPLAPAFAERLGNPGAAARGTADFLARAERADARLGVLLAGGR